MEFFTATRKLKKVFFFFTTRNVRCVHHGWHGAHRYDIQVLATQSSACVARIRCPICSPLQGRNWGRISRTCRRYLWDVEDPYICHDFGCRKPNRCTDTVCCKQPLSLKATSTQVFRINKMDIDRKYPIVQADRITTEFGPTVLLIIRDKQFNVSKVFMPRRYSTAFSDEILQEINTHVVTLILVYKGLCSKSNLYVLCTEQSKIVGRFYYCVLKAIRWVLLFLFMHIWHWATDCLTIIVYFYVTGCTTHFWVLGLRWEPHRYFKYLYLPIPMNCGLCEFMSVR